MIQHRAAQFVLSQPWNRHHRDSISEMLHKQQARRKQARLTFLFKILNNLVCIPNQYLPSLFPVAATRSHHPLKLQQLYIGQEQIYITILFYPEQYLIGTIYILKKSMSWISLNSRTI